MILSLNTCFDNYPSFEKYNGNQVEFFADLDTLRKVGSATNIMRRKLTETAGLKEAEELVSCDYAFLAFADLIGSDIRQFISILRQLPFGCFSQWSRFFDLTTACHIII